jgi:hypothetical protein
MDLYSQKITYATIHVGSRWLTNAWTSFHPTKHFPTTHFARALPGLSPTHRKIN